MVLRPLWGGDCLSRKAGEGPHPHPPNRCVWWSRERGTERRILLLARNQRPSLNPGKARQRDLLRGGRGPAPPPTSAFLGSGEKAYPQGPHSSSDGGVALGCTWSCFPGTDRSGRRLLSLADPSQWLPGGSDHAALISHVPSIAQS